MTELSAVSPDIQTEIPAEPTQKQKIDAYRGQLRARIRADQNGVLLSGGIMAGIGWVLIYQIVRFTEPRALNQWLFFIALYAAVTGTVIPVLWALNRRFAPLTHGVVILREGLWCGLIVVLAMWLQKLRALTPIMLIFLVLGILAVELFLRVRESGS